MKTKVEIIEESVRYIETFGRAVDNQGACMYKSEKGNQCLVGRALNMEYYSYAMEGASCDGLVDVVQNRIQFAVDRLDDLLKEEYKGHNENFWVDLQHLHDNDEYFIEDVDGNTKLSRQGKNLVDSLKEKWRESDFKSIGMTDPDEEIEIEEENPVEEEELEPALV